MSKRARVISQQTPKSMSDALSLESAPMTAISLSRLTDQNGNERQSAQSVLLKPRYPYYLTIKDLTSLIAPPFKVKTTSYGYNTYLRTNESAAAGNLRTLYSPSGQQYWFESIGLPARDLSTNPTTLDVNTLILKAPDVRNVANVVANTGLVPQDAISGPQETSFEQQFQYLSGFQRHQFVNSGNTTVYCEFWELHPRHPMIGYKSDTYVLPNTIGYDVLQDYKRNQPLANTLAPTYTTTSYDSVNDMSVRITPSCDSINAKYKVSKPVRVTIQPGGTFVYTMKFEPFKFTNSEWNVLVGRGDSTNPVWDVPHWMPGFTKILCGRMHGELSHSAAVTGLHGHVGPGPLSLDHIQTEYHHCRAVPYQPTKNTIIDYRLDTDADMLQHEDELEQNTEAFAN